MKNIFLKIVNINSQLTKSLGIAILMVIIIILIPVVDKNNFFKGNTAKAAEVFIENSIKATQRIKSMVIKLKIRTIPNDNFCLTGTEYNMVEHTIWKSFVEPVKWRIDKGERVVVYDGKSQYLWLPNIKMGIKSSKNSNFTEWLNIFLDPEKILFKEQKATKDNNSKFVMNETNSELFITVTSKAQGNFINDYCKNKSIEESDNRRDYTFDSKTKLLKRLRLFILDSKKETLILEIEKIEYNVKIDSSLFSITLPKGTEWNESVQSFNSETYKNISSKKVTELFFDGMANNNWKQVEDVCDFFKSNTIKIKKIKEYFGGLKVITIGEPFKSGLYPGEFVPYEIKLKSGEIKKFNLVVRNDNRNKIWVVDGGF